MHRLLNLLVLLSVLCLPISNCMAAQSQPEQQPDPYENTSILVEAFVVRVSNAALAESGVNPIGQAPDAVSPLNILWCLKDEEKAQVIGGAKLACRHKGESKTENRDTFYMKREITQKTVTPQGPQPVSDVRFDEYDSGVTFFVNPAVKSDSAVSLFFSYSESGIKQQEDKTSPPNKFSYKWDGRLTAYSGKPVIAAAVQDEQTTTFLVLTAAIQNAPDAQQ